MQSLFQKTKMLIKSYFILIKKQVMITLRVTEIKLNDWSDNMQTADLATKLYPNRLNDYPVALML